MRLSAKKQQDAVLEVIDGKQSVTAVSLRYQVARKTLYQWMERYQNARGRGKSQALVARYIRGRSHVRSYRWRFQDKVLRLISKHPAWGATILARELGCGRHAVVSLLNDLNQSRRVTREQFARLHQGSKRWQLDIKAQAVCEVLEDGKTVSQVSRDYYLARKTLYSWIRDYRVTGRVSESYARGSAHPRFIPDSTRRQVLAEVVLSPRSSLRELASLASAKSSRALSVHGLWRVLKEHGLTLKTQRVAFAQRSSQSNLVRPLFESDRIHSVLDEMTPQMAPAPPPELIKTLRAGQASDNGGWSNGFAGKHTRLEFFVSVILTVVLGQWVRMLASAPSLFVGIGWGIASLALLVGSFFFAYSFKYYLTIAVVLSFSRKSAREEEGGEHQGFLTRFFERGDAPDHSMGVGLPNKFSVLGLLASVFGVEVGISQNSSVNKQKSGLELNWEDTILTRYPFISVQIPLYNEKRVAERAIRACLEFDYPQFEVLVLDDSTDETTEIVQQIALDDPRVKVLHRPTRAGYKGGALQYAAGQMDPRAELTVVFDADFVPYPDTLTQFVKYLVAANNGSEDWNDSSIAAVQGYQWHVLNKSENWITRGVRSEFAGSYVIERSGAEVYGGLKQIAGSVYMLRVDALKAVGGWGTSITEDFELTLKLYEAGYKVLYTPYIQTPSECVSTLKRLIRQRMRWAEGHSNNIKRRFFSLIGNENLTGAEKIEFAYLSPYYLQAFFFLLGTFFWLISEVVFRVRLPFWTQVWGWSLVLTNMISLPLVNAVGLFMEEAEEKDYLGLLAFMGLSYILAPFQAYAAVKGFFEDEEGPWFRTPKTGKVTDVFKRGSFYRWITQIFPGRAEAEQIAEQPSLAYLTLSSSANRFDAFLIKSRGRRWVGRAFLSLLLAISTLILSFSSYVPTESALAAAPLNQGMIVSPDSENKTQVTDSKEAVGVDGFISPLSGTEFAISAEQLEIDEGISISKNDMTLTAKHADFSSHETVSFQLKKEIAWWEVPLGWIGIAPEIPEVVIKDVSGNTVEGVLVTKATEGTYDITFEKGQPPAPGKYELSVSDGAIIQDFTWGVLAFNTNKSVYTTGETVHAEMAVLNDKGQMECAALVELEVTSPGGSSHVYTTQNGEIIVNPECISTAIHTKPDYSAVFPVNEPGEYLVRLSAEFDGRKHTITDAFLVQPGALISLERKTATRIYPLNVYPVEIVVTVPTDFSGTIIERVPEDFVVVPAFEPATSFVRSEKRDGQTLLYWNIDMAANETLHLGYGYDAPDVSPAFYTLGPAELIDTRGNLVFQENRSWQIAVDEPDSNGMLVYSGDADTTPHYRSWSGTDLGNEANLTADEANHGEVVQTALRSSPVEVEYIYAAMGYDATDTHLDVQVFDNGGWTNGTNAPTDGDFTTDIVDVGGEFWYRAFDVAYEETTGHGLVVYENDASAIDAVVAYRTWNGSAWSNEATWTYPATADGDILWIRMAARPGTDDILIAMADRNGDLKVGLWDGANIDTTNDQEITTSLSTASHRAWDVVYEQSSGTGMVLYGTGTALDFCLHDGTTCTDQNDAALTATGTVAPMWVELSADPGSDYIALMTSNTQTTMDLFVDMWDGTDWDTAATEPGSEAGIEEGVADDITQAFDVAWERGSDQALFVFSDVDATSVSFFTYDISDDAYKCPEGQVDTVTDLDNAEDSDGPCDHATTWADDVSQIVLEPSKTDGQIMLTAYNDVTSPYAPEQMLWSGIDNTFSQTATMAAFEADLSPDDAWTEASGDNQPQAYAFAWESNLITVSGTVYNFGTANALTECNDSTAMIAIRSAGFTATTTCTDAAGAFTKDVPAPPSGTGIVLWIDEQTTDGSLVIRYDGSGDSTGNVFYDDAATVVSDDSNAVDIIDMDTYDNGNDGDIPYTATNASPDTLVVNDAFTLLVSSGEPFTPTGNVTVDDIEIAGTYTAGTGESITVSGSWNQSGTFTASTSTVTFDAPGATTENIFTTGTGAFNNVTFNDGGGGATWEVEDTLDVDGNVTITGGTLDVVSGENNQINIGGNWTNDDIFNERSGKVVFDTSSTATLDSNCAVVASCSNENFYDLELSKSASGNTVTLTNFGIRVANTLTLTTGTLVQGAYGVRVEGSTAVSVAANGIWSNTSTGDLTLGGSFANSGAVTFQGTTSSCGETDAITITSTDGTQRSWTGLGSFTMNDVSVQDQGGTAAITVYSGTSVSGNNSNWVFSNCVYTSTAATATGYSFQRKTFYDDQNSTFWRFFHDGDEIDIQYSQDSGATWVGISSLAYDTNDFSVWWKSISGTEYIWLAAVNTNDVLVRQGTLSGTGITWDSDVSTGLNGSGASDDYAYATLSQDSSNYLWVGARHYNGTNYIFKTAKSGQTGDTDPVSYTWTTTPYALSTSTTSTNVYGVIVPLDIQDMYATFVSDTALRGCTWDNSDTAWENSAGVDCVTPAGWLAGWDKRMAITVSTTNIDSDLTYFPVLLTLGVSVGTAADDTTPVFDELVSDANRKKIAVTKSDGTTEAYVEIENWNDALEVAQLWVSRSDLVLSGSADTTLYLYYDVDHADNTTYVGDINSSPGGSVWNSNYSAVYHLAEDVTDEQTTATHYDSTANNYDGTQDENVETTGVVHNGQYFGTGPESINTGDNNLIDGVSAFTVSGWFRRNASGGEISVGDEKDDFSAANGISFYRDGNIYFGAGLQGSYANNNTTWHHTTVVYDGSLTGDANRLKGFLEGSQITFDSVQTIPATSGDTVEPLSLGVWNPASNVTNGDLDEIRISNIARPAAWVKAEYYSTDDNLVSWGDQEVMTTGSKDTIDTVPTGLSKTISVVSDPTNNDVHLLFVDDETTDQISYKRWDRGTLTWDSGATLVADAVGASDAYPTLSYETSGSTVYAMWIDTSTSHIFYASCAISTECNDAAEWTAETDWKSTGTNNYLTSNYSGANAIFAMWTDGSGSPYTIQWDLIVIPEHLIFILIGGPLIPFLSRLKKRRQSKDSSKQSIFSQIMSGKLLKTISARRFMGE